MATTRLCVPLCVVGGALLAQPMPTVRITSPVNRTVVHPGESLKVMVEPSPADAFAGIGVIGVYPIGDSSVVTAPPFECTVAIPSDIRPGVYAITAAGMLGPGQKSGREAQWGRGVPSAPITLLVERADQPVRLEVYPPTMRLQVGIKGYLSVTGVFADGQQVDLKESSTTIFTSDTPRVVTVDPKSIVNPMAPGSAKITVSNGKAKVEVPVVVSAPRGR